MFSQNHTEFANKLPDDHCLSFFLTGQCNQESVLFNCPVTCAGCTAPTQSPTESPFAAPARSSADDSSAGMAFFVPVAIAALALVAVLVVMYKRKNGDSKLERDRTAVDRMQMSYSNPIYNSGRPDDKSSAEAPFNSESESDGDVGVENTAQPDHLTIRRGGGVGYDSIETPGAAGSTHDHSIDTETYDGAGGNLTEADTYGGLDNEEGYIDVSNAAEAADYYDAL